MLFTLPIAILIFFYRLADSPKQAKKPFVSAVKWNSTRRYTLREIDSLKAIEEKEREDNEPQDDGYNDYGR